MVRLSLLVALVAGAAPQPLASDDVATRQAAAVAWAKANGPVRLGWPKAPPEGKEPGCRQVRAPRESGCSATAWACPVWTEGGTSDWYSNELRVVFLEAAAPPTVEDVTAAAPDALLLRRESGEDAPELECGPSGGLSFGPGMSDAQKQQAREAWERAQERERARCIQRARQRAATERVVLSCELLVVNPCRREAFVRCGGKNLEADETLPRAGVRRFTW
ncbi:MAG: hypothetical protein AB1938_27630 [Myxococcota bacterium]